MSNDLVSHDYQKENGMLVHKTLTSTNMFGNSCISEVTEICTFSEWADFDD